MAQRKTTHSAQIIRAVPVRTPAPIIQVRAPRAPSSGTKKKKHHRKRSGAGGALTMQRLFEFAIGGAIFGFAEKQFGGQLPTIPLLGRKGSITAAAYFMSKGKSGGIIRDVALAGAVLSGYDLGSSGAIHGEVVPQISGIAAQV